MNKKQKIKIYRHFADCVRKNISNFSEDDLSSLPQRIGCTESTLQSWLESTEYDFSVTITQAISLAQIFNISIDALLIVPQENVLLNNLHELMELSGDVAFNEAVKVLSEYMSVVEEDVAMGIIDLLTSGEVDMIGGRLCVNG